MISRRRFLLGSSEVEAGTWVMVPSTAVAATPAWAHCAKVLEIDNRRLRPVLQQPGRFVQRREGR